VEREALCQLESRAVRAREIGIARMANRLVVLWLMTVVSKVLLALVFGLFMLALL